MNVLAINISFSYTLIFVKNCLQTENISDDSIIGGFKMCLSSHAHNRIPELCHKRLAKYETPSNYKSQADVCIDTWPHKTFEWRIKKKYFPRKICLIFRKSSKQWYMRKSVKVQASSVCNYERHFHHQESHFLLKAQGLYLPKEVIAFFR